MPFLGIMQGRLSPKAPDRLQSFPATFWRDEFQRAADLGLGLIEWLVDDRDLAANPLFSEAGRDEIAALMRTTGVGVQTACAHVFIDGALNADPAADGAPARRLLAQILSAGAGIGIARLVIPLMESASLARDPAGRANFVENLRRVMAEQGDGWLIALETDLNAADNRALLDEIGDPRVGVCYDLGNATAFDFDVVAEIDLLCAAIVEVHVKDRIVGGGSRLLGEGDTRFGEAMASLARCGYGGPVIMETPVGDDWLQAGRHNTDYIRGIRARYWEGDDR